ncbi:Mov34-domain-containing protein [Tothia fuscella]|uniref:COP9 signalosome complex subunit 5 n=1 Tax=Tothia fuscella TaxID=1048955 RepID=A0A9P4U0V0_9PEZI|nr:Mov34-domain-containing protein [Tothia fuscella]
MDTALKSWELENAVQLVDPTRDAIYNYSSTTQKQLMDAKPWKKDPHHFKNVRISAVALLKMVMHARSGGSIEVMGLMQGSVYGDTFVVSDAFRLPVEGTETRVNAQEEANEYLIQYLERARENDQADNVVGWYHSHPGYGCWLSGIDVNTQATQQLFQDPFCAVVIDPDRTISAGKVEIGAFRTFPDDHKPEAGTDSDGFQSIPMDKIQDFGAHAERYYSMEISHFKSTLDTKLLASLWNKYWIGTLSSSPLLTNRDFGTRQIKDLAFKIHDANVSQSASKGGMGPMTSTRSSKPDEKVEKIVRAARMVEVEERVGLVAAEVKEQVFGMAKQ